MSDSDTAGFGKFVPGFDFLQNLVKGAGNTMAHMPDLGHWIAPTFHPEELDKRIEELKNVRFWLEQNSRALDATIQALEVQKMTLATLKGMNVNIGDVVSAFTFKAADPAHSGVQGATDKASTTAKAPPDVAKDVGKGSTQPDTAGGMAGLVDPLQLWGSLTQQFQQIAAGALQQANASTAANFAKHRATGPKPKATKPASRPAAAQTTAAPRAPARKAAGR